MGKEIKIMKKTLMIGVVLKNAEGKIFGITDIHVGWNGKSFAPVFWLKSEGSLTRLAEMPDSSELRSIER